MIELSQKSKVRIRRQLRDAVKEGIVIKPDKCSGCNKSKQSFFLHGHHEDYSKPLEVKWLCHKCHGLERRRGKLDKPKRDKNRDRIVYMGVLLPKLKESPFVNSGILTLNITDEHNYYDKIIDWPVLFRQLTYREREIIKLRYGFNNGYTYTLKEVAQIFKMTRQGIKYIEQKALKQLRKEMAA